MEALSRGEPVDLTHLPPPPGKDPTCPPSRLLEASTDFFLMLPPSLDRPRDPLRPPACGWGLLQASPSLRWTSLPPDQLPPEPPSPPPQPPTPATVPSTPGRLLGHSGWADLDKTVFSSKTLNPRFPSGPEVPPPPRTLLEALEQRMERYRVAAAQAKTKGDQRKARMHERIVKVHGG